MEGSQVTGSELHKFTLLGNVFPPQTPPQDLVLCSLVQINTCPCNEAGKRGGTKALAFI